MHIVDGADGFLRFLPGGDVPAGEFLGLLLTAGVVQSGLGGGDPSGVGLGIGIGQGGLMVFQPGHMFLQLPLAGADSLALGVQGTKLVQGFLLLP